MACETECAPEIHVADVGTEYRMEVLDNCEPFDPSDADVMQLIFQLPGGDVLVKTASLETDNSSPATRWYLTYTVQPDDGFGSPPDDFHAKTGPLKVQFYLEYTDGRKYHSTIQTKDTQGRTLRVYKNLD